MMTVDRRMTAVVSMTATSSNASAVARRSLASADRTSGPTPAADLVTLLLILSTTVTRRLASVDSAGLPPSVALTVRENRRLDGNGTRSIPAFR